jgi:hypothetical protein
MRWRLGDFVSVFVDARRNENGNDIHEAVSAE